MATKKPLHPVVGQTRTYQIKFDVENGGRAISGVQVTLSKFLQRSIDSTFSIDLSNDPLYPALVAYVQNNPLPEGATDV